MEADMEGQNADIKKARTGADAVKELDGMKKRLGEMKEEDTTLREMQIIVEREMGPVQDRARAAATNVRREKANSRSKFVRNVGLGFLVLIQIISL
ncbi:polyadenylate-binding protein 2-like isoform X2 [Aristolochia californica]|uniref:polyadenylate-binding protein 2-like isoform X2 n=1 Tax=Aristolochia californica TaxID=171875 RepID=UPI0035DC0D9F